MRRRAKLIGAATIAALALPITSAIADPVQYAGAGVYREFGFYKQFPAGSLYVDWYSDQAVTVETPDLLTSIGNGAGHYFAQVESCAFGPCNTWWVVGDAEVVVDPVTQAVTLDVAGGSCPMHVVWHSPGTVTPGEYEEVGLYGPSVNAGAIAGADTDWNTDGYACGRAADSDDAWSFVGPYAYAI